MPNSELNPTASQKRDWIVEYADDMKADRIESLDVRPKTSIADFFIVCTGTSDVHVNSIVEKVAERMRDQGLKPLRKDIDGSGWSLLDFGDVILHVMREERRQFYDLETLWTSMQNDPNLAE